MGRREDFLTALAPLQQTTEPALQRQLSKLLPTAEDFERWEDSVWLGLFLARRMTGVLASLPRVERESAAGRVQNFLEKAQGDGAFFDPQALARGMPLAMRRTCCVRIDGKAAGSGFLVGPDLVLTNWHVVVTVLAEPTRISVAFDYLHEAGAGPAPLVIAGAKILRSRTARAKYLPPDVTESDPALDYALIRLASSLPGDRGHFDLAAAPGLTTGSRVVIFGHPQGRPLAMSFSRSAGLHHVKESHAYYDADTLHGSSGSLVLLEHERDLVCALLHAGGETPEENFGVHLKAIHADLRSLTAEAPAPAVTRDNTLETYMGTNEAERGGRFATLVSLLPTSVHLNAASSVADQIASLNAQGPNAYAEALEIARTICRPALPDPVKTHATEDQCKSTETPAESSPAVTHGQQRSLPGIVLYQRISMPVGVLLVVAAVVFVALHSGISNTMATLCVLSLAFGCSLTSSALLLKVRRLSRRRHGTASTFGLAAAVGVATFALNPLGWMFNLDSKKADRTRISIYLDSYSISMITPPLPSPFSVVIAGREIRIPENGLLIGADVPSNGSSNGLPTPVRLRLSNAILEHAKIKYEDKICTTNMEGDLWTVKYYDDCK